MLYIYICTHTQQSSILVVSQLIYIYIHTCIDLYVDVTSLTVSWWCYKLSSAVKTPKALHATQVILALWLAVTILINMRIVSGFWPVV